MKTKKTSGGFTLLEVMIVVAILGILATIAYASYTNQVMRSNRADAHAALNDVAQRLQRCYTTYSSYNNAECGVFTQLDNNGTINSGEGLYEITGNVTATQYTLTAEPVGPPQTNDDACSGGNNMTLDNAGRRTPDDCW